MWRSPGRLAFVAALLSAVPCGPDLHAVQTDVRGNWQVNIDCDLNATASIFLLEEPVQRVEEGAARRAGRHVTACRRRGVPRLEGPRIVLADRATGRRGAILGAVPDVEVCVSLDPRVGRYNVDRPVRPDDEGLVLNPAGPSLLELRRLHGPVGAARVGVRVGSTEPRPAAGRHGEALRHGIELHLERGSPDGWHDEELAAGAGRVGLVEHAPGRRVGRGGGGGVTPAAPRRMS